MDTLDRPYDLLVVGAGAAGLAAGHTARAAGLDVVLLEARDRVGGRTLTVTLDGIPGIDLGAHWMHAARWNPMARAARRLGIALTESEASPLILDGRRALGPVDNARLWRAWGRIDRAISRKAALDPTACAADAFTIQSRWDGVAAELHGNHACGMGLDAVGTVDFANALDNDDRFVAGGFGALVERLRGDLPVRLNTAVERLSHGADGVVAETTSGRVAARAALVTIPTTLLARDAIAFEPAISESHRAAALDLPHGHYERVVFRLDRDPFGPGRDRLVLLLEENGAGLSFILSGGGGPGIHFADLGGAHGGALAAAGADAMTAHVGAVLDRHFGAEVAAGFRPLAATGWSQDPWLRGAWSVARPGRARARLDLARPIGRLWFAGEATSVNQWGTVGGAWQEGERAAREIAAVLRGPVGFRRLFSRRAAEPGRADDGRR